MSVATTFQLFAKAPVPGTVKTRLHCALGPEQAATLHARMIRHAAAAVTAACAGIAAARGELWCAPDTTDSCLGGIAARHALRLRRQSGGDLGARMRDALAAAMPGKAILLGSDAPALDAPMLIEAARALDDHDIVIIPADDGGYVLIGCRHRVPACFDGIRWSTPAVMDETRARLAAAGTLWRELPAAWDVDTPADLERLAADVRFSHLLDGLETAEGPGRVNSRSPAFII